MQAAALFLSLQTALIPQGLGLHGSMISGLIDVAKLKLVNYLCKIDQIDLLVILEH